MLASIQLGILIFTIAFNVILALFVYRNNPKSATNILFGILSILLSIWIFTFYPAINRYFSLDFLFWAKVSIFIGAPQALVTYLFVRTMPGNKLAIDRKKLNILYVITLLVMLINISPFAFTGVAYVEGEPAISAGIGIAPFAIYSSALTFLAIYTIYKKMRSSAGREREQAKFIMIGITALLTMAILTILIPVVMFNNNALVPFAPLYALIFLSMTAYAVIHEGLLDVKLIVARAVSFIFVNVLLAAIYGLAVFLFLKEAPLYLEGTALYASSLFVLVISLLTFEHVERGITMLSNKIFFKKEYDPESLMDQLTRIMVDTLELGELTQKILKKLTGDMNITKGVFVVFDDHKISSVEGIGYPIAEIKSADLGVLFDSKWGSHLLFEEMEESPLKNLFRDLDISLAIPIAVDNKEVAILLLGRKLSGDVYFDRDVQFLDLFAREAGIAIQNSKSYNEIKLFNKELESRVQARTKALRESQKRELEKAKSVAKLKDEFVFVAAHELRAPITAIRGFLELVSGSNQKIPKDVKENLGEISYVSDHLNQLVNDLLEIARSEADAMKIDIRPVDIGNLVTEVLKELAPVAKKNKVSLQIDRTSAPMVLADESKVKEILVNLIGNSIKYNKESGLVFIEIVSIPSSDKVFIEIRDTGYGIPSEDQDKIFKKFFRSASENTSKVLGTGLGLFITRMLVEKMGGEISFTSIPGGGTTFSFYLKKAE